MRRRVRGPGHRMGGVAEVVHTLPLLSPSAATAVQMVPLLWLTLWLTPWLTLWLTLWLVRDTARPSTRRMGRWALCRVPRASCAFEAGKNAAAHMFVRTQTSAEAAEQG